MSLGHFSVLFHYPISCHLHSRCNDPSKQFPSYFSAFSFSLILRFSACAWVGDVNWNNSLLVAMPLRKMAALSQASFNWWGVASHEPLNHPWWNGVRSNLVKDCIGNQCPVSSCNDYIISRRHCYMLLPWPLILTFFLLLFHKRWAGRIRRSV